MARINAKQGNQLTFQLGTQVGNAITYADVILINTNRSFKIDAETESGELVDLANLSLPAVMKNYVKSKGWTFDGSGTFDANSASITSWIESGAERPCKVGVVGGLQVTGNAICSSFQISGDRVTHIESQMTVISSGDYTIT